MILSNTTQSAITLPNGQVMEALGSYGPTREEISRIAHKEQTEALFNAGDLVIDGMVGSTRMLSYLRSSRSFASTFAVDKNDDTDQLIDDVSTVLIVANRVLWDLLDDYNLSESAFYPSIDGIWNLNGTITVKSMVNVARIRIDIYRNDELYFTVTDKYVAAENALALPFSCDVDAYKSENHNFDIRIRLDKIDTNAEIEATISGSDEETAWGMTFLHPLEQDSPT